jgi:hypothetical protein
MTDKNEINVFENRAQIDDVLAQNKFIADGYLPTDLWKATDINGHLLIATRDIQDFKDMHLWNKTGVTIIRNYVKTEITWVREDPFPEETAGKKALSPDEVIKFLVDGLGITLEEWQEELLRQRVANPDRKINIASTTKSR